MAPIETDSSLRAKIGYLETRNAYEHHDLTSQIEALQKQVERLEAELDNRPVVWAILESKIACLEAELADRPVVFAIQHIETKTLAKRDYESILDRVTTSAQSSASVDLYATVQEAEVAIQSEFFNPELWKVVIYTRTHCNDTA